MVSVLRDCVTTGVPWPELISIHGHVYLDWFGYSPDEEKKCPLTRKRYLFPVGEQGDWALSDSFCVLESCLIAYAGTYSMLKHIVFVRVFQEKHGLDDDDGFMAIRDLKSVDSRKVLLTCLAFSGIDDPDIGIVLPRPYLNPSGGYLH